MPPATQPNKELDDLAFQLYSQRVSAHPLHRGGEKEVREAYVKAQTFLDVRARVHAGELATKEPTGPQLADCCAPNLPKTHPINLVAAAHTDRKGTAHAGDLSRVAKINKFLNENPTPEKEPDELVDKFARTFPDLGWDLAQIATARQTFPAYCKN